MKPDALWKKIQGQARKALEAEPLLDGYLRSAVLDHPTLEAALARLLSEKLADSHLPAEPLWKLAAEAFARSAALREAVGFDLEAVTVRDPAAVEALEPFLHYKGFHALEAYRVAHWLWGANRRFLAHHLQNRISEAFAVDIHPAARIGKGIFIDHATGLVIGETAVVGDNVSLLHEVTLGGTGKETGIRHPQVASGVMIGAGAKVLGRVRIGRNAKIGAGSVVLDDVPAHTTVAGVPAKVVGRPCTETPALQMDQTIESDRDGGCDQKTPGG